MVMTWALIKRRSAGGTACDCTRDAGVCSRAVARNAPRIEENVGLSIRSPSIHKGVGSGSIFRGVARVKGHASTLIHTGLQPGEEGLEELAETALTVCSFFCSGESR